MLTCSYRQNLILPAESQPLYTDTPSELPHFCVVRFHENACLVNCLIATTYLSQDISANQRMIYADRNAPMRNKFFVPILPDLGIEASCLCPM